jgi:hypothetical protein
MRCATVWMMEIAFADNTTIQDLVALNKKEAQIASLVRQEVQEERLALKFGIVACDVAAGCGSTSWWFPTQGRDTAYCKKSKTPGKGARCEWGLGRSVARKCARCDGAIHAKSLLYWQSSVTRKAI